MIIGSSSAEIISGNSFGSNVVLGASTSLTGSANFYGYKLESSASTGTGKVYGIHIKGADENYLQGSLQLNESTKVKKQWHGWFKFAYDANNSAPAIASSDSTGLPAGFSFDLANSDMSGTASEPGFIRINLSGDADVVDMNKAVIQITPRYMTGATDSTDYIMTGSFSSTSIMIVYFRRPINSSTQVGTVAFSFTLTEYE